MRNDTIYETKEFSVDASELIVNRTLLEHILGYKVKSAPEAVSHILDNLLAEAPKYINAKCGFRIVPPEAVSISDKTIQCNGIEFHTQPIISKRLQNAQSVAVFVCTIGSSLEQWSKKLMDSSDVLEGYIVDQIGSEMVECVADRLEQILAACVKPFGWKISNRYSPGYCGWSVVEQHKLFSLFPQNFCGIRLTESALMVPIKSVSGIIGLGSKMKAEDYECSICDMTDCFRRNNPFPPKMDKQ